MKKILVCLIAIVVVINLSAQVEGTIQWRAEIDFTYPVNGEYIEISFETGYVDELGMPQIPYCVRTFLIPVNAQPAIQIKYVNRKLQKKDVLLYPVQPPTPIGESSSLWVEPNSDIYNSSNPFPGRYVELVDGVLFSKDRKTLIPPVIVGNPFVGSYNVNLTVPEESFDIYCNTRCRKGL